MIIDKCSKLIGVNELRFRFDYSDHQRLHLTNRRQQIADETCHVSA